MESLLFAFIDVELTERLVRFCHQLKIYKIVSEHKFAT